MTDAEVVELARFGVTRRVDDDGPGMCALCARGLQGSVALCDPGHRMRSHRDGVHASCAAPVLSRAVISSGRAPIVGVSGLRCAACSRSFRFRDQVVLAGRDGSRVALHARTCRTTASRP